MCWREHSGNSTEKAVFLSKKPLRRNSRLSVVGHHLEMCVATYEAMRQFCRHIAVLVKTPPFAANEPYYGNVISDELMTPSQDIGDIIAAAVKALASIWTNGHRYAKAGCMLNDFTPTGGSQLNLLDDTQPRSNSNQLMKVVDGRTWKSVVCRAGD